MNLTILPEAALDDAKSIDFIVQEMNNKQTSQCDFKEGDAVFHKKFGNSPILDD